MIFDESGRLLEEEGAGGSMAWHRYKPARSSFNVSLLRHMGVLMALTPTNKPWFALKATDGCYAMGEHRLPWIVQRTIIDVLDATTTLLCVRAKQELANGLHTDFLHGSSIDIQLIVLSQRCGLR